MYPGEILFGASPFLLAAFGGLLAAPRARRLLFMVGGLFGMAVLIYLLFSSDCHTIYFQFGYCQRLPQAVADMLGTPLLFIFLAYVLIGPATLIVAILVEWRSRRR